MLPSWREGTGVLLRLPACEPPGWALSAVPPLLLTARASLLSSVFAPPDAQ